MSSHRTPATTPNLSPDGASERRVGQILAATRLVGPLAVLVTGILVAGFLLLLPGSSPDSQWPRQLALGSLLVSPGGAVRLEVSVARICQGEPGSSEALRNLGVLGEVAGNIADLNAELTDLYEDMDNRVARQIMRLAQKTASLKILYDVAAGINQAESIDELVLRYLRVIKEMVNGHAATVRLAMADGSWHLLGSRLRDAADGPVPVRDGALAGGYPVLQRGTLMLGWRW